MPNFADRLVAAIKSKKTPLVVGLDPRAKRLPTKILAENDREDLDECADAYVVFCKKIIDVVAPLVPAVKPQAAFFEQLGPAGSQALQFVTMYARDKGLLVIMDAKRGDIGSTAEAYAAAYLGEESPWPSDALTVNPYLGEDSLTPFVNKATGQGQGSGLFVLVKTSNPGGKMLQDLVVESKTIYNVVADYVESLSAANKGDCGYGNIGAVVGATHPAQLKELRARMPSTIFLVPGFGAQGGSAEDVAGAFDENGLGAVVNSSRGIIFAYEKPEFAKLSWEAAVEQAARQSIDQLREFTPAGKLV